MAVKRDNPYTGYNFQVDLGGGVGAGFSEVSGLSLEIAAVTYREGSDRRNTVRKLPGLHKAGDVTLKRGLAGTLELFDWVKAVRDGDVQRRMVTVTLLDEQRQPVLSWKLVNAWPMKLVHGPLLAAESQVAIEELVLACETLEIE